MDTFVINNSNHSEWLRNREQGIGSSEVATILGVDPYSTPYQLWLRKTKQVDTAEKENKLMKLGHLLEDAIAKLCADEAGLSIIKNSASEFLVVDKNKPFMRVSPDRYAYPLDAKKNAENKVIIECKSTQKSIDPTDIPDNWFIQVSYQMHVTRIHSAYIAWLTQGRDFDYKTLRYDASFCEFIEEEVERFWVDCIIGGKEPPLTTVSDVLIKFPKHTEGKITYADESLIEVWSELRDTSSEIKRLDAVKSELEDKIKTAMLDSERLVIQGDGKELKERTLATWKAGKESVKFDAAALKEAEPEVYARYLKTTDGSRRFMLKQ